MLTNHIFSIGLNTSSVPVNSNLRFFLTTMSSTTAIILQECISSLSGRHDQLNDAQTVSGESSRRFNTYIYSRKLLIRKSIVEDQTHHLIYCTHCTRAPWRVSVIFTTTSAQLRHLRRHHSRLPTSQEEENTRVRELNSTGSTSTIMSASTPFTLASTQGLASRSRVVQFDNKVYLICVYYNYN